MHATDTQSVRTGHDARPSVTIQATDGVAPRGTALATTCTHMRTHTYARTRTATDDRATEGHPQS